MPSPLESSLSFLMAADALKGVERQSLIARGDRRENTAEHSWHLGLAVLVLKEWAPKPFDLGKALSMALLHDLAEIGAGDTFAYDQVGAADQFEREEKAFRELTANLPAAAASDLASVRNEFETKISNEARFVAALDRVLPILLNLQTQGHSWRKHGVTHQRVIARNREAGEVVPELWEEILRRLEVAVQAGHLAP